MNARVILYPESAIEASMIAPCGMNCALCSGFVRGRKPCPGCNGDDTFKPAYCVTCRIRHCTGHTGHETAFCHECETFPCARLKQLDKRYRTKYGMSMLENLAFIREQGIEAFVAREKVKWKCPDCGGVISVHKKECVYCGRLKDRRETGDRRREERRQG